MKSLCEVSEGLFCDIEMKARLCCITENVVDPCVWAVYHEKMYRESGTNSRKMYISGSQVEGAEPFKFFNTRHSARRCGIRIAGFQFCSGPIFPQNTFISVSWNCNI